MIDDKSLIGHFTFFGDKFKQMREVSFHENSRLFGMSLIENNTKLITIDLKKNLISMETF